ncbi:hypothetical protein AAE02nite_11160 [Adhaeribacter aerolatus]|uniref:Outer membrane protein beta-barrel domain-containing protein n=1 Tax=Adhaeribacter aerolatus TaxID=670289 RepID=A0A512AUQ9_9BACT|nr:hypothetical protein [Adhaeribacter aerolatus]GEO03452.1 hypothetical protein AAE02nite_11160 [Adhaeribacter aerolatus]
MKLKLSGAVVGFLLIHLSSFAQDSTQTTTDKPLTHNSYKTAIGIQLTGIGSAFANPKGLSIKYFVSPKAALEFNLTPGGRNILSSNLAVLRHFPVSDAPQVKWYAGTGLNFDVYRYPRNLNSNPNTNPNNPDPQKSIIANTTTLMGVLGAEYQLPKLPFTISGDIRKGFLGFTHRGAEKRYNIINGLRPSISFRYTFRK